MFLPIKAVSAASAGGNSVPTETYNSLTFVVDLPSSSAVFSDGTTQQLGILTNTPTMSASNAGASTTTLTDGPDAVDIISNQPFTVPVGQPQAVLVDFNAFESLALQSGSLVTNPVLYLAPTGNSGRINGTVVNADGQPVQNATVVATDANGNVGNTRLTDSNGAFEMSALSTGSYTLSVYNNYTNAAGQQFQAIGQSNGAAIVPGPQITITTGDNNAGSITD